MFFDGRPPADFPAPPTPDEVAGQFSGPLLTLAPQAAVEETDIATETEKHNDVLVMEAALISYQYWRNPDDRSDPANLAEIDDQLRAELDREPPWSMPEWLVAARERRRYPVIWQAVRTTHMLDDAAAHHHSPEQILAEHVDYIVMNIFRGERMRGPIPGELIDPANVAHIRRGVPVVVDGQPLDGFALDTDPHVYGLGARVGESVLTTAISRDYLDELDLSFVTRTPSQQA
ncbi:hypothetical protein SAMN04489806_3217 [Paramicrobacterium humi]|uniref:Uncharacterized protein n=1 Tax=Paramicrobacterium humi TaxID=640635 RepID=A0A1H4TI97_9MICO|nr:hypothetical protein [Microbacterium humi]SEC55998.1 hypothetical protein SAMN04489806_3217 [Microbacterium humi]